MLLEGLVGVLLEGVVTGRSVTRGTGGSVTGGSSYW
jgi:hypothetical protein